MIESASMRCSVNRDEREGAGPAEGEEVANVKRPLATHLHQ